MDFIDLTEETSNETKNLIIENQQNSIENILLDLTETDIEINNSQFYKIDDEEIKITKTILDLTNIPKKNIICPAYNYSCFNAYNFILKIYI